MSAAQRVSALDAMLDEIAATVRRIDGPARPAAVAAVLGGYVADPDLLAGRPCPGASERYARHLLGECRGGRYAVAALVWRPGQMSRVHSHRVWCALAVHRGVLTETRFAPAADEQAVPEPCDSRLCRMGAISHGAPDPRLIHRVANLGCEEAVSIHVYGIGFAQFATEVNHLLTET